MINSKWHWVIVSGRTAGKSRLGYSGKRVFAHVTLIVQELLQGLERVEFYDIPTFDVQVLGAMCVPLDECMGLRQKGDITILTSY